MHKQRKEYPDMDNNQNNIPHDKPKSLSERALARRWDISCRTLQRMHGTGSGPACLRINNTVRYSLEDVLAFEAQSRRFSEDA